jgi:histidinol-phosphate aminotransferase
MANVIRTFLDDQEEVLTSEGTFVGIYVLTNSRGVKLRTIPLNNYRYDLPAIARAISPATKIIYLANPNNPTGSYFTQKEFEEFHTQVPPHTLIILDEAYFEFAAEFPDYPDSLQYRYDNVITLRTFSKAYGLAGLRIGYGFAAPALIGNLLKVKLPFEPSIPAAAAGIGALADREFLEMVLANNSAQRSMLMEFFSSLGYRVLPSATNFITLVLPGYDQVEHLSNFMLHNGIILRPLNAFGLPHCLRITVGTREENARLMQAMRAYHN